MEIERNIDGNRGEFETGRLRCGPWIQEAERIGADLARTVAGLLTPTTTIALPQAWQGDYTIDRARSWIDEREADSTTLLVIEKATLEPRGLIILAGSPLVEPTTDVRIGYLLAETSWGQGFGTELLAGLVEWAREQPPITTLTGGVDPGNKASIRVLERSGFRLVRDDGDTLLFRVDVGNERDISR